MLIQLILISPLLDRSTTLYSSIKSVDFVNDFALEPAIYQSHDFFLKGCAVGQPDPKLLHEFQKRAAPYYHNLSLDIRL